MGPPAYRRKGGAPWKWRHLQLHFPCNNRWNGKKHNGNIPLISQCLMEGLNRLGIPCVSWLNNALRETKRELKLPCFWPLTVMKSWWTERSLSAPPETHCWGNPSTRVDSFDKCIPQAARLFEAAGKFSAAVKKIIGRKKRLHGRFEPKPFGKLQLSTRSTGFSIAPAIWSREIPCRRRTSRNHSIAGSEEFKRQYLEIDRK